MPHARERGRVLGRGAEDGGPPADGTNGAVRMYGADRSGLKSYRFNSLGFRGEEPDPAAAVRILVCGCSHGFGTGLDVGESHRVSRRSARAYASPGPSLASASVVPRA